MLMLLVRQKYCQPTEAVPLLQELEEQSRMILALKRTLKS